MPRSCGLHRTTRPLEGTAVGEDLVVSFHDHAGRAFVHLPMRNELNRWTWRADPIPVHDREWIETLEPLPPEGFYVLHDELSSPNARAKWPRGALVQLGYDRSGNPILFLAQQRFHRVENALLFADRGIRVDRARLDRLEPVIVYEEPDPNASGGEADVRPEGERREAR